MTVPSTPRRAGPFNGNAATTAFPFTFKVFDKTNIQVVKVSGAGVQSTLTLDSDYSVSVNADQTGSPGGTVTFPITGSPLAVGESLSIVGALPYAQTTTFPAGGNFPPSVIEATFDKLAMQDQQLLEGMGRTLQLPAGVDPATVKAQLPAPVANALVGWNATAQALQNVDPATLSPILITTAGQIATADGGTMADALVSKLTRVVDSIAAVRALGKTQYTRAFVTGYYAAGDGGGGVYRYDAADTTSSDNAGTVIVATDGGRWKLVLSGAVSVLQFGAKGDGATSDAAAFNAAFAVAKTVYVPFRAAGYLLNSTVTIGTGQFLVTENPGVTFLANTGANAIFRMTGADQSGIIGGACFNMAGTSNGATAIRFGTSSGIVANVRLKGRLTFRNCWEAIGDEAHATNYVVDVLIEDVYCLLTKGQQVYSRRSRGFFLLRSVVIDQTANPAGTPVTWAAARFEDFIGLELERFDALGGGLGTATYQATAYGLQIAGSGQGGARNASVWLGRVLVDNSFGNGVLIDNVKNLVIDKVEGYQNLGYQIKVSNSDVIQIGKAFAVGAVGVTGASASQQGITFDTCTQVQINQIISNANTGSGVLMASCDSVTVTNWQTASNGNNGWAETGTGSIIKLAGASSANGASSLVQAGTNSACLNWRANAGTYRASDTGAVTV